MSQQKESSIVDTVTSIFHSFTNVATTTAKSGATIAHKGLAASREKIHSAADKLGLRDKVGIF
jgi:hypothetical protein